MYLKYRGNTASPHVFPEWGEETVLLPLPFPRPHSLPPTKVGVTFSNRNDPALVRVQGVDDRNTCARIQINHTVPE